MAEQRAVLPTRFGQLTAPVECAGWIFVFNLNQLYGFRPHVVITSNPTPFANVLPCFKAVDLLISYHFAAVSTADMCCWLYLEIANGFSNSVIFNDKSISCND